jgi:hypothetical protein
MSTEQILCSECNQYYERARKYENICRPCRNKKAKEKMENKILCEMEYARLRALVEDSTQPTDNWVVERCREMRKQTLKMQNKKPSD